MEQMVTELKTAGLPLTSYLAHKDEIDAAIARVLARGWYILGDEVAAFEKNFARYIGVSSGIGVGSGTDALQIAIRACGIGRGDEVITVAHTAVATVAAIELCGATPVLVDIDPQTYTISPDCIRKSITKRTKAVIPVHLYGHPADMDSIMNIADANDIYVIEDCAQSHGASIGGRKTGAFGDMAAFSFYPTKNLGALGDGGMVVTGDAALAERARLLREYGWKQRYISMIQGLNTRLDELQAVVLNSKLKYLDIENERRRKIAGMYNDWLLSDRLLLPGEKTGNVHVYHQYAVRSGDRDVLKARLREHGVDTQIHYPVPVHLQPAYRGRLGNIGDLPVTEKVCGEILSLPMNPWYSDGQIQIICQIINRLT